ncbi:trypsin CFT-1-like [Hyposmocoma kahamanoa]|uniref:trypsin CFT-1-like n=1 Tax=Hyposmocoma kahamanoa TaxID=1477025 RepID=UPI000E6D94F1|nr:trypsin CFT-1-like [Hyposmocoma kahamanoa]
MLFAVALIACWGIVSATVAGPPPGPYESQRIIGGSATTNYQYIFTAALLFSQAETTFTQQCGGSILNQRTILTAAHCFSSGMVATRWRARVGSSWANSGGYVHLSADIMNYPQYNPSYHDNDFSLLRLSSLIQYISGSVGPGSIAGSNYNLADNQIVWAIGWGETWPGGSASEQLRHVQLWTVNQQVCAQQYATQGSVITNSMLCAGYLDVGGRGQCAGDDGSPLLHNNVIVGVYSWGLGCGDPYYPSVNARITYASNWIQAMA